ncbi:hypothetical protein [Ilyobacter sp.]|jgi:hypothetical protein|uniref:hypothetical protein n=1 Tax=Ilyobacter sp. TaxID=3100343 RepID=UPI003565AE74
MSCNKENCTCPNTECIRHGKCCECINNHMENGITVYCMKDNDSSYWDNLKK